MTLNVTMKEDSKQLDEVVVVGYGTTTRKNLTTSIATVKTEKISRAATSNMSQMLLGRAAAESTIYGWNILMEQSINMNIISVGVGKIMHRLPFVCHTDRMMFHTWMMYISVETD